MEALKEVRKIIVHCSMSDFGDAREIDAWHRANDPPFDMIGYQRVILNGNRQSQRPYDVLDDGLVENGRELKYMGDHVLGHNHYTIGICLIGKQHFTGAQILMALPKLLMELLMKYKLRVSDIQGHHELDKKRTCPNLNMDAVRDLVRMKMAAKIIRGF